jgi:dynein intermediate chain
VGGGKSGLDSGDLTPLSIPGSPSIGQVSALPGQSALSLSGSGRASRQSDLQERVSIGASTLAGLSNSGTDHVIER